MSTSGFKYLPPRTFVPIFDSADYIYTPIEFNPSTLDLTTLRFNATNNQYYELGYDIGNQALFLNKYDNLGLLCVNSYFFDEDLVTSRQIRTTFFLTQDGGYASSITFPNYGMLCDDMISKSGMYLSNKTDGSVSLSVKNVNKVTVSPTSVVFGDPLRVVDGTAAAPSYSFVNDADIGLYRIGTNTLGVATNGLEAFRVDASNITSQLPVAINNNALALPTLGTSTGAGLKYSLWPGATNTLSYSLGVATNTLWYASPSVHSFYTGAGGSLVQQFRVDTNGISTTNRILSGTLGTVTAPAYSFSTDDNTGMYSGGADQLNFGTNGVFRAGITNSGLRVNASGSNIQMIRFGRTAAGGVAGTITVSFGQTFPAIPTVVVSAERDDTVYSWTCNILAITTTNFTYRYYYQFVSVPGGNTLSPDNHTMNWIAMS